MWSGFSTGDEEGKPSSGPCTSRDENHGLLPNPGNAQFRTTPLKRRNTSMSWKELYEKRRISPEASAKLIKSRQRVVVGSACACPEGLIDALLKRSGEIEAVEIVAMVSAGSSVYARPEYAKAIRHNCFFVAPSVRKAVEEDRADYTPN